MNANKTKEECSADKYCDYNNFKKVRYFHGMLLTDRDFREEQIYHNEKRKLLNRMLHGWGVVCGLGIEATSPKSCKIVITPGMALDCNGNEIVVCEKFEVDLKQKGICAEEKDKDLCAEMKDSDQECKYYVAIKYTEVATDPVPVYVPGGACDDKSCDYSRTREGFCVKLFKTPPCHAVLPKQKISKQFEEFCKNPYGCTSCCCDGEPYVILGSIDFKTTKCKITTISQEMICLNDERRYIRTPLFWDYLFLSFFPAFAPFLANPFTIWCRCEEPPESVKKMTEVQQMNVLDAKEVLAKHQVEYHRTVPLTPSSALAVMERMWATKKIEPKMKVDLITDNAGNALFYIPSVEEPEKVDLQSRLDQAEKTIGTLEDRLKKLETDRKPKPKEPKE